MKHIFTSESVTIGHPDKVCDQVADAILDALLSKDPNSRVACEVTAINNKMHIMGEITSSANVDYIAVARNKIKEIGYTDPELGFDDKGVEITLDIHTQSPDISQGVSNANEEEGGAGDQGMMFGYACDDTDSYMPLSITLANRLIKQLEEVRQKGIITELRPDGKAQVSVEYENGKPTRIATVVLSTQHDESISEQKLHDLIIEKVIKPSLPKQLLDKDTVYYINPTGRFIIGGPAGDSGLTGRKIIVDTYGGMARHGGGSFSGKDPTKVDKSGAYMARYIAKNIVASGLAKKCEVQIAYAIGVAKPVSVFVDTFTTGKVSDETLANWVLKNVDMRPGVIIKKFNLRKPIYEHISCHGHFGENAKELGWEQLDLVKSLQKDLG